MNGEESVTMSVRQCAAALGVSPRLVYRLVESRELPAVHVSNRIVIPRDGFTRWLETSAADGKHLGVPD